MARYLPQLQAGRGQQSHGCLWHTSTLTSFPGTLTAGSHHTTELPSGRTARGSECQLENCAPAFAAYEQGSLGEGANVFSLLS